MPEHVPVAVLLFSWAFALGEQAMALWLYARAAPRVLDRVACRARRETLLRDFCPLEAGRGIVHDRLARPGRRVVVHEHGWVQVYAHTIEEAAEIVAETRHFRPDLLMRRQKE